MPLVNVIRNPEIVILKDCTLLGGILPRIVAIRLSCEGAQLKDENIKVRFHKTTEFDVNVPALTIEIIAEPFPERLKTRDERAAKIAEDIVRYHKRHNAFSFELKEGGFVALILAHMGIGKF